MYHSHSSATSDILGARTLSQDWSQLSPTGFLSSIAHGDYHDLGQSSPVLVSGFKNDDKK